MTKETQGKVDTVRLQSMARAFIESASLYAAIDLGLFTAVAKGNDTVERFAEHAGISEVNAERLMTMCAATGTLVWQDDHYVTAPDTERYLVEGERGYAAAWLQFTRGGWQRWGKLTEHLKNAETPKVIAGSVERMTIERAREYHAATSSIGFGSGRRFARQVDLSSRKRLMDVGGGSGAYSIVAVQTYPELEAVVFDLPPIVPVTQEFIDKYDVADRVTTVAGDFTADPLPADCDVAIMASNLPQYSREIIGKVIAKAHDTLLPGGEMHLIGEMLGDDRTGPKDAAIWGLNEALSNSTGLAHSRSDCVGYFEAAGFADIGVNEFVPGILARVSGVKALEG